MAHVPFPLQVLVFVGPDDVSAIIRPQHLLMRFSLRASTPDSPATAYPIQRSPRRMFRSAATTLNREHRSGSGRRINPRPRAPPLFQTSSDFLNYIFDEVEPRWRGGFVVIRWSVRRRAALRLLHSGALLR